MEQLEGKVLELERQIAELRDQLRRLADNASTTSSFGSGSRPMAEGYMQAGTGFNTYKVKVSDLTGTPVWTFERVR